LATSFVHRFREEARAREGFVDAAGPLQVGARRWRRGARRRTRSGSPNARAAGGGVLMYSAIHGVDRLRWFFADEVVEVAARTRRYTGDHDEVEDGVAALLTFAGGGAATLTANAPTYPADPAVWETEVHGRDAMVRMRTRGFAETNGKAGAQRYVAGGDEETARPHYNFERQAVDFLAAIAAGRDPSVSGEDGMRALEICLAVYRSAETGRPVAIDELRQGGDA
jgi:UDP-N-acetyl-2-amino-2-deoxyglucuronate dehydrogenase